MQQDSAAVKTTAAAAASVMHKNIEIKQQQHHFPTCVKFQYKTTAAAFAN